MADKNLSNATPTSTPKKNSGLKQDKFEILRAAKDAKRIADFVMDRSPDYDATGPKPAEETPAPTPEIRQQQTVKRSPAAAATLPRTQQGARQGVTRRHGSVAVSTLLPDRDAAAG